MSGLFTFLLHSCPCPRPSFDFTRSGMRHVLDFIYLFIYWKKAASESLVTFLTHPSWLFLNKVGTFRVSEEQHSDKNIKTLTCCAHAECCMLLWRLQSLGHLLQVHDIDLKKTNTAGVLQRSKLSLVSKFVSSCFPSFTSCLCVFLACVIQQLALMCRSCLPSFLWGTVLWNSGTAKSRLLPLRVVFLSDGPLLLLLKFLCWTGFFDHYPSLYNILSQIFCLPTFEVALEPVFALCYVVMKYV